MQNNIDALQRMMLKPLGDPDGCRDANHQEYTKGSLAAYLFMLSVPQLAVEAANEGIKMREDVKEGEPELNLETEETEETEL